MNPNLTRSERTKWSIFAFFISFLLFAFFNFLPQDLSGQSWQIFTTEYTYNAGAISLERTIKTKKPVDVMVTKEGVIWLACADQFPISISNINKKEYIVEVSDMDFFEGIDFKPSENSGFATLPDGEIVLITRSNFVSLKDKKWSGYNTRIKKKVGQSTIPVLKFDQFADVSTDKQGNLWVSGIVLSDNETGLAKLSGNQWEYYMVPAGISNTLISETKGTIIQGGKEKAYAEHPYLKLLMRDITFDNKGNIWMSAGFYKDLGLFKFSGNQFDLFNQENGNISSNLILGLTSDKDGTVHFSTPGGLYIMGADDKSTRYEQALTPGPMMFDKQGFLWVGDPVISETSTSWKSGSLGTETAISRYDSKTKSTLNLTNQNTPLISGIKKIYADENSAKYFIVDGVGLYILKDTPTEEYKGWTVYSGYNTGKELMSHYYMTAGYNDREWNFYGTSHYGSERVLNSLKDGAWSHSEFSLKGEPRGLLSNAISINDIGKDINGNLLLGTSNYIYKLEEQSSWLQGLDQEKVSKSVNAVASDQAGTLWFGTNKGLARYDGNSFSYFDKSTGLPDNWILSLHVDNKNRTWVGTPNGILCMEKDKNTLYNKKNGLDRERVVAIINDSKGKTWFGIVNFNMTAKALYYEEEGQIKQDPLPMAQNVEKMVIDKKDNIWISDGRTVLCRKSNGEYIEFNDKNSPLKPAFTIDNLFVVGDELWLMITTDMSRFTQRVSTGPKPAAEVPVSKEVEIANSLKPKLTALKPLYETIIFKIDETF